MSEEDTNTYTFDRIEEMYEVSNVMHTYNLQKKNIQTKVKNKLIHSQDGGTFNITMELINFVAYNVADGKTELVIMDKNDTPILVKDLKNFLNSIQTIHQDTMKEAFEEHEKIVSSRNLTKVFDLDE